jgi:hypothetical protein
LVPRTIADALARVSQDDDLDRATDTALVKERIASDRETLENPPQRIVDRTPLHAHGDDAFTGLQAANRDVCLLLEKADDPTRRLLP